MKITFMIGMPGAGKSTFIPADAVRICPDEIRKELYGDISIQGDPKEVFGCVYKKIRHAIRRGNDFVYDATNADERGRKSMTEYIRKCARQYGEDISINAVFIDTPVETCIERNLARKDRMEPVPEEVIRRMAEKLKNCPPSLNDGFDKLERRK